MALIDVIIPAYNAERTIESAVSSILSQTERRFRIIVVDDGSQDRTAEILCNMSREDYRIELVSRPNGGVVAALSTGAERIEAPFIARLDADDLSAPDRFERQLARFAQRPELIAVSGGHAEIDVSGQLTGQLSRPRPLEHSDPSWIPAREPQIIHSFLMARTDAFRRAGGYRPGVMSEDTDLFWRLMEVGPVENLEGLFGYYRMHDESLSSKSIANARILCVCSQFSAISARRRRSGRPDIVFPFGRDEAQRAAVDLDELVEQTGSPLNNEERRWFRRAVSAKMMELTGYRPVEPDERDCRFIASQLADLTDIAEPNQLIQIYCCSLRFVSTGAERIEAPFIARLDADDLSAPDRFERQLARFAQRPELIAVSGGHAEIDVSGQLTGQLSRPRPLEHSDPSWIPAREPQIIHSFLMARTDAFRRAGGYRPGVMSEDTDLFWRLMEVGPVENLEGLFGYYRMHDESLSSKSIANARILCVCSQFSAISARRRRSGRPDIVFPFGRDEAQRAAVDLDELVEQTGSPLNNEERRWFRRAVSAKMMELTGYRPVEPDERDCRFIASQLADLTDIAEPNRRELRKILAATSARMVLLGRYRDARRIAFWRLWPEVLARAITRRLYWTKPLL